MNFKNKYKISSWIAIFTLMFSLAAARGPEAPSANKIIAEMTTKLSLSAEQVTIVTPIIQSDIGQRKALMENARTKKLERDTTKEEMDKIEADTKAKLAEILTEEQMTKWEELKKSQKPQKPADGKPPLSRNSSGQNDGPPTGMQ
jgi:hypothetical protein